MLSNGHANEASVLGMPFGEAERVGSITERGARTAQTLLLAAILTFVVLGAALVLLMSHLQSKYAQTHDRLEDTLQVASEIPLFAEELSLAAHLFALSGEEHWRAHYRAAEPELVTATGRAGAIGRTIGLEEASDRVERAIADILTIEHHAINAAASGDMAAARALLESRRYGEARVAFAQHNKAFVQVLRESIDHRLSRIEREEAFASIGVTLVAFLLLGLIMRCAVLRNRAFHRQAEAELRRIALHDSLTGLHNHAAFELTLEHHVNEVNTSPDLRLSDERTQAQLPVVGGAAWTLRHVADTDGDIDPRPVLVSIDLNGFRAINDKHGHAVGDAVLGVVAERLATGFSSDFLARIDGDEFMVLAASSMLDLSDIRGRVVAAIRALDAPIRVLDLDVRIGASAGLARIEPGMTTLDIRRAADLALYAAKRQGARSAGYGRSINTIVVFDDEMYAGHLEQLANERRVRRALNGGEFVAFFQPVVNLKSGAICGVEALARWVLGDGRVVPPGSFVPALQQLGLLPELTWVIVDHACRAALAWPYPIKVSINVEPTQLDGDFAQRLFNRLAAIGFPPNQLIVEVLETALATKIEDIRVVLQTLRAGGVEISLDDFGVGYSSLGQLSTLPIDNLKIDRTFITAMSEDACGGTARARSGRAVVQAALDLSRSFRLRAIAEGVETQEDVTRLAQMGCGCAQGYFFARPLNNEAFTALLAQAHPCECEPYPVMASDHAVSPSSPPDGSVSESAAA